MLVAILRIKPNFGVVVTPSNKDTKSYSDTANHLNATLVGDVTPLGNSNWQVKPLVVVVISLALKALQEPPEPAISLSATVSITIGIFWNGVSKFIVMLPVLLKVVQNDSNATELFVYSPDCTIVAKSILSGR